MSPEQKSAQIVQLCEDARALVIEGIQSRHPEYTLEEVHHAAYRIFIGDQLYREVWPDKALLET
jgi:hypothetical protein